jgi:pseudo-rSAM protein
LIKQIYKPENFGVTSLSETQLLNSNIYEFVNNILEQGIGDLLDVEKVPQKPIRLIPILNLQKDVEKLTKNKNNEILLAKDIVHYLLELNIYLNESCCNKCKYCDSYYKQISCCTSNNNECELHTDLVENIFQQIAHSPAGRINILGGNILKYSRLSELIKIINPFKEIVHCYVHYKNYTKHKLTDDFKIELIVPPPIDEVFFENILKQTDKKNTNMKFIIENEEQYLKVDEIINKLTIDRYEIHPFFTNENIEFFEQNVFMSEADILSKPLTMREIFRNKKLNANFFGKLNIMPNGNVSASANSEFIGNIHTGNILDLIYKELINNTSWRKIRDNEPCCNCLYQFICPAPSNYELAIGRMNLCNYKNKITDYG